MRQEQTAAGKKPMYDGRSRNLGLERSKNTVLRLATPEDGEIIVNDIIRGQVKFENNELDDLILLRSDGSPTYHLCNVVDDFEQGVSSVIRGEDHLSNTPRQIHIQNALEYPSLEYAHLPTRVTHDGGATTWLIGAIGPTLLRPAAAIRAIPGVIRGKLVS